MPKFEREVFNSHLGNVEYHVPMFRVQCKRALGPWSHTKLEAVLAWSKQRFGLGIIDGRQYDDDGRLMGRVFAVQTRIRSGRFCKSKTGAALAFLFRSKHDL